MDRTVLAGRTPAELSDGIDQLHGLRCAVDAELLDFIAVYDLRQHWAADGATCMEAWLVGRLGWTREDAHETVRVARELARLPLVAQAYRQGRLSWVQVRALTRMATPDSEAELVEEAYVMSAAALRRLARRAKPVEVSDENDNHRRRKLRLRWDEEGLVLYINGSLPQAEGAVVEKALTRRADQAPVDPNTGTFESYETRCADALVEMASTTLSEDADADRATVVVHVDAEVLAGAPGNGQIQGGPAVSAEAVRRMACDARWQIVAHAPDGTALGIGRLSRTPTPAMYRELRRRDATCRFPGCERRRWVAAHHMIPWAEGGRTDLDNLILLCGYHHRLVHEGGWRITGSPETDIQFLSPEGHFVTSQLRSLRAKIRSRFLPGKTERPDPPPGGS